MPKITFIGAGSVVFTKNLLGDILTFPELQDCTISLHDIDPVRLETARAIIPTTALVLPKKQMLDLLHTEHAFSDRFIAHILLRNARLEADLVDQLFNSSEKRLARALLLLARYGKDNDPQRLLPTISQGALAEMVGTTRSRVNFFLNKFRKLGFIEYDAKGLTVNPSLLSVVVHD